MAGNKPVESGRGDLVENGQRNMDQYTVDGVARFEYVTESKFTGALHPMIRKLRQVNRPDVVTHDLRNGEVQQQGMSALFPLPPPVEMTGPRDHGR